jgi:hypothetical protein
MVKIFANAVALKLNQGFQQFCNSGRSPAPVPLRPLRRYEFGVPGEPVVLVGEEPHEVVADVDCHPDGLLEDLLEAGA